MAMREMKKLAEAGIPVPTMPMSPAPPGVAFGSRDTISRRESDAKSANLGFPTDPTSQYKLQQQTLPSLLQRVPTVTGRGLPVG